MSGLLINLFGPPRIELTGAPINVDTRKAIALIAYLAVTRQQHSRDSLATLLWSENDQPHARAALRRTLSSLNKAIGGRWLDIERETLGLNFHAGIRVDVHDFRSLLAECGAHGHPPGDVCSACTQPLSAAVALYQDDLLAGFSLRDSLGFDDWQFYQADTLRREFASALEKLTRCHSAQHHFDIAIAFARRWLALDKLHEPAHHQLMLLFAWAGQRTTALQQYRECVQALEQELGVSPLETTTHLYQLIKENKIPAPPPALPAPVPSHENVGTRLIASASTSIDPVESHGNGRTDGHKDGRGNGRDESRPYTATTGYPLVGRMDEWATILKTYQAINGGGRVIVLEGDAGIGKTRLADELLAHARDRGANIISASCYEGESQLAYAPILVDDGVQHNVALNTRLASQCGIEGLRLRHDFRRLHLSAEFDAARRSLGGRRRGVGGTAAAESAENVSAGAAQYAATCCRLGRQFGFFEDCDILGNGARSH